MNTFSLVPNIAKILSFANTGAKLFLKINCSCWHLSLAHLITEKYAVTQSVKQRWSRKRLTWILRYGTVQLPVSPRKKANELPITPREA